MRCETARKQISDLLDGALAPERSASLEAHVRDCPACRAYQADLVRLQAGAAPLADRSPEYWAGFERRLASKLDSVEAGGVPVGGPVFPRRKLALAAAGFLALAAVASYFALFRPGTGTGEMAWAIYEDPLAPLLLEAEADPEFGSLVNRQVLESIGEMAPEQEAVVPGAADPLFWASLSDRELEFIAAELAKETGSGGPK